MSIIAFKPEHYFAMYKWWEGHGVPIVDYRVLPPFGLLVPGVCAGWLYMSDAPLSFFAWPVSNPDAHAKDILDGFEQMIDTMREHSKEQGKLIMVAYTGFPSLSRLLIKHGFSMEDMRVDQFVCSTR